MTSKVIHEATTFVIIGLLAISAIAVFRAYRQELRVYHRDRMQRAFVPGDPSLIAVEADGGLRAPGPGGVGGLPRGERLVVFVIHAKTAERDIAYWGRVIRGLARRGSTHGAVEFWGVCDDGARCVAYQKAAAFPIFGFLDPYEMRIVALAGARGEALVYQGGKTETSVVSIPLASNPRYEPRLIFSRLR